MARLEDILVQGFVGGLRAASQRPTLVDPSRFLGLEPGSLPSVPADALAQTLQAAVKSPALQPRQTGFLEVEGLGPLRWDLVQSLSPQAQATLLETATKRPSPTDRLTLTIPGIDESVPLDFFASLSPAAQQILLSRVFPDPERPRLNVGDLVAFFDEEKATMLKDVYVDPAEARQWIQLLMPDDQPWTISEELANAIGMPRLAGAPADALAPFADLLMKLAQRDKILEQINLDRDLLAGQMLPAWHVRARLMSYGVEDPILPQPDAAGLINFDQALDLNLRALQLTREQVGIEGQRREADFEERRIAIAERETQLAEEKFRREGQYNPIVTVHTASGPRDMPLHLALQEGFIQPDPDRPGMVQVSTVDKDGGAPRRVWMPVKDAIDGGFIRPNQQLWTFSTSQGPQLMTIEDALKHNIITSVEAAELQKAQADRTRAEAGGIREETRWMGRLNRAKIRKDLAQANVSDADALRITRLVSAEVSKLEADTERIHALAEESRQKSLTEAQTREAIVEEIRARINAKLAEEGYKEAQRKAILDTLDADLRKLAADTEVALARAEQIRAEQGELTIAEKTALASLVGLPPEEVLDQPLTRAQLIGFRDWLQETTDAGEEVMLSDLLRAAAEGTGVTLSEVPQGSESEAVNPFLLRSLRSFVEETVGDLGLEEPMGLTVADLARKAGVPDEQITEAERNTALPASLIPTYLSGPEPSVADYLQSQGRTPAELWKNVPLTPQWYERLRDGVITWGDLMELRGASREEIPSAFFDVPASNTAIAEYVRDQDEQQDLMKTHEWSIFKDAFNQWTRVQHGEQGIDLAHWITLEPDERRLYLQGGREGPTAWQPFEDFVLENMQWAIPAVSYVLETIGASPIATTPPSVLDVPTIELPDVQPEPGSSGVAQTLRHYWDRIRERLGIEPPQLMKAEPARDIGAVRQQVLDDAIRQHGSREAAAVYVRRRLDDVRFDEAVRQMYGFSPRAVLAILEGE